jgi:hypothetical protein
MAKTKREAVDQAQQLIQQRKRGRKTDEAEASLEEFLQRFLASYKKEGGVALRTWQEYRYHIEKNVIPGIGAIALADVNPRGVDFWVKSLRERG